jgi:hypothetical protein
MKKRLFLASCAVTLMAGATVLSSCGNAGEEYSYNPEKIHENVISDYKASFIRAFGEVSPMETWDYSLRGSSVISGKSMTRTQLNTDYLCDWRGTYAYGYVWNYEEKSGARGYQTPSAVNDLYHNHWSEIVEALNGVNPINWNPSSSDNIVFRTVGTTRNDNTKSKYFALGIEEGGYDLYLRLASPANGNNGKNGNTVDQHTSSLSFTYIPATAKWFVCSTTAQNKNKVQINIDECLLTQFKEVTVNIGGADYTFWGFKCDKTNGDYTDLVLWVQKVDNVPVVDYVKRYFVEDLGQSDDFDFNDAVFDVCNITYDGQSYQMCYIRALGGTLPITINVGNKSWSKDGSAYAVKDMVNTSNIDYDLCLDAFEVSGWNPNANNVSVTVEDKDGYKYGLPFPEKGDIPFIIATYDGKYWMSERQRIPGLDWLALPNE